MVIIICTQFGTFITKWTINTPIVIFNHVSIMQNGSSYLSIIPLNLNHVCPHLEPTYKIRFLTICVLCVVFKPQYFWSCSRKTDFWPFLYIFQRTVIHSKSVRLTRLFLLQVQDIPIYFSFLEYYHFIKIMKWKCKQNKKQHIFVVAILDFWRPTWIENKVFLTLQSFHGNDHFYQFWAFFSLQLTGKTIWKKIGHPKKIWTLPVKIFPFGF